MFVYYDSGAGTHVIRLPSGGRILINTASGGSMGAILDSTGTYRAGLYTGQCQVGGATYRLAKDANRVVRFLERSSTRVVLQIIGLSLHDSTLAHLANEVTREQIWTIYEDQIWILDKWVLSGNVTLDNDTTFNTTVGLQNLGTSASRVHIRYSETDGVENTGNNGGLGYTLGFTDCRYVGTTSTEINTFTAACYSTEEAATKGFVSGPYSNFNHFGYNNATLAAGTHVVVGCCIFDLLERTGGKQYGTAALRAALALQLQGNTFDTPSVGGVITDEVLLKSVGSAGKAGDGAIHFKSANALPTVGTELTVVPTSAKTRQAIVLADWPIASGGTGDNHTLGQFQLDDNAANNTIAEETTNSSASWVVNSTLAARNTSSSGDSVDAINGKGLRTNATASMLVNGLPSDFISSGAIMLKFIPKFAYNVASNVYIASWDYTGNRVNLFYNATDDKFQVTMQWGGGTAQHVTQSGVAFTSDLQLQRATTCWIAWDASRDCLIWILNGVTMGIAKATDAPATAPAGHKLSIGGWYSGTDVTSAADIIIDKVKVFNAPVIPYGAVVTYSPQSGSYSSAHPDILLHWKPSDTTAEIGGVTASAAGTFDSGGLIDKWYNTGSSQAAVFTATSGDIWNFDQGSVTIWFKATSLPGTRHIFNANSTATAYKNIYATIDNAGAVAATLKVGISTSYTVVAPHAVVAGTPYCLQFVWHKSRFLAVRINGSEWVVNTSPAYTTAVDSTGTVVIGGQTATGLVFPGLIGPVYVTGSPYTPQCMSNLGKEIWMPKVYLG